MLNLQLPQLSVFCIILTDTGKAAIAAKRNSCLADVPPMKNQPVVRFMNNFSRDIFCQLQFNA